jgi:hypothetical protein
MSFEQAVALALLASAVALAWVVSGPWPRSKP